MSGRSDGQTELVPSPVAMLDESKGILEYSVSDLNDIDPDRRITLARLALDMGALLGPLPAAASTVDRPLQVAIEDLRRAEPTYVDRGLYIWKDDPRYENGELLIKTRFAMGVNVVGEEDMKLPFDIRRQPGVVFHPDEYHTVARSAPDLVRATRAKTRRANQDLPDREEAAHKVNRSAAHIMAGYIVGLTLLEDEYVTEHKLLTSLYKQTRAGGTPQNQYKAVNLDRARHQVDELFHETIETAAVNNGWGQKLTSSAHRAVASNLYRRGSSREIDLAWQRYIRMQGLYINARWFKLIQSRMACESQHSLYQPYLEGSKSSGDRTETAEIDRTLIERAEAVIRQRRSGRGSGSSRSSSRTG